MAISEGLATKRHEMTRNRNLDESSLGLGTFGKYMATAFRDINRLCDVVRETGFAIHRYHRHGHLEKIYENALIHRLRIQGLEVSQQYPLRAYDEDGTVIGDLTADMIIESQLIVELKAVRVVLDEHVAQLLGYLRASRIATGLLINFGAPAFQIKKYLLSPEP